MRSWVANRLRYVRSFVLRHGVSLSVLGFLIGIAVLAVIPCLWKLHVREIIKSINVTILALMVVLYFCYLILRTLRLSVLLSQYGLRVPAMWLFKTIATSNLVGQFTVGNIGEASRIAMLKRKLEYSRVRDLAVLFVVEKTSDAATTGLFAVVSLFMLTMYSVSVKDDAMLFILSFLLFGVAGGIVGYFFYVRRHSLHQMARILGFTVLSNMVIYTLVAVSFISTTGASLCTTFMLHYVSTVVGLLSLVPSGRGPSELTQMSMANAIFGLDPSRVGVAIAQVMASSLIAATLAPCIGFILCRWSGRHGKE